MDLYGPIVFPCPLRPVPRELVAVSRHLVMLCPTEPFTCRREDAGVGCCPRTPGPPVPSSCLSPWPWLHGLGKGKGGPGLPVTAHGKQPAVGITPAAPIPEMQCPWGGAHQPPASLRTAQHLLTGNFLLFFPLPEPASLCWWEEEEEEGLGSLVQTKPWLR